MNAEPEPLPEPRQAEIEEAIENAARELMRQADGVVKPGTDQGWFAWTARAAIEASGLLSSLSSVRDEADEADALEIAFHKEEAWRDAADRERDLAKARASLLEGALKDCVAWMKGTRNGPGQFAEALSRASAALTPPAEPETENA